MDCAQAFTALRGYHENTSVSEAQWVQEAEAVIYDYTYQCCTKAQDTREKRGWERKEGESGMERMCVVKRVVKFYTQNGIPLYEEQHLNRYEPCTEDKANIEWYNRQNRSAPAPCWTCVPFRTCCRLNIWTDRAFRGTVITAKRSGQLPFLCTPRDALGQVYAQSLWDYFFC